MIMIKQRLAQRETRFQKVEGSMMPSDVLTKGMERGHVELLRQLMGYCRYRIRPTSDMLEERRSARPHVLNLDLAADQNLAILLTPSDHPLFSLCILPRSAARQAEQERAGLESQVPTLCRMMLTPVGSPTSRDLNMTGCRLPIAGFISPFMK